MRTRSHHPLRPVDPARARPALRCLLMTTAATCLLSFGTVVAQETADTASSASAGTAKPAKQEKICRFEDVTGSRMRKRICHTQEQWDARERAAQNLVRELDAKPVRDRPIGD